jgi:hypothetical protein
MLASRIRLFETPSFFRSTNSSGRSDSSRFHNLLTTLYGNAASLGVLSPLVCKYLIASSIIELLG